MMQRVHNMIRHGARRKRLHPAQALVEFALVAPLLLSLLFVLIELGVVFSVYVGLTNSAREGARAGSIYRYPTPEALNNTAFTTARGTIDGGRAAAVSAAVAATGNPLIGALTPTITYTETTAGTGTSIYRYGEKITVRLTYTHNLFFNILGATLPISAESEMMLEPGGL